MQNGTDMQKILFFDGPDKAGKTTLMRSFQKATNFKRIVVDRGVISCKTYNNVFNRNTHLSYEEAECLNLKSLSILVYADEETLAQRFKESNEPPLPYGTTMAQHLAEFHRQYDLHNGYKMKLDTSKLSVDECIALISQKLEQLERE